MKHVGTEAGQVKGVLQGWSGSTFPGGGWSVKEEEGGQVGLHPEGRRMVSSAVHGGEGE